MCGLCKPDETIQELINKARQVRQFSYAPYSNYAVGACILTEDGEFFAGCNVENAAFPLGICAEQVAVGKAISAGKRAFRAIAIVGEHPSPPCGGCRQVLFEFGAHTQVIIADLAGNYEVTTVGALLPKAFLLKGED